jgi:hypothetical protein
MAASGANIYAGSFSDGVFLSTNNGNSWSAINTGLPPNTFVSSIGINGSNIFAGTSASGNGLLYLSTNNGGSWTIVNTGLADSDVHSFAFIGANIFVGRTGDILLSPDSGLTWTLANAGLPLGYSFSLNISGTNIFVGIPPTGGVWSRPLSEMISGIKEVQDETLFTIAPNPFNSQAIISFAQEQKNATIKITDLFGKEIKAINFTGKRYIIQNEGMKAGVYYVQITDETKNISTRKIIVM